MKLVSSILNEKNLRHIFYEYMCVEEECRRGDNINYVALRLSFTKGNMA